MQKDYKDKILTIPNILTLVRLALIPVIVWLYIYKEEYAWTAVFLVFSGVTDLVDGYIARRFNMISDLGKAIDPVADKLTQFIVLICLVTRFTNMLLLCVLLMIKETVSAVVAMLAIHKTGKVEGADWHGKVTTCLLYATMILHVLWVNIPENLSNLVILVCTVMMLVSFALYNIRNFRAYNNT